MAAAAADAAVGAEGRVPSPGTAVVPLSVALVPVDGALSAAAGWASATTTVSAPVPTSAPPATAAVSSRTRRTPVRRGSVGSTGPPRVSRRTVPGDLVGGR